MLFLSTPAMWIFPALFLSCSSQNSETTNPSSNEKQSIFLVSETAESLPKCDTNLESTLAYVKTSSKFFTCSSTQWSEVQIKEKGTLFQTTELLTNDKHCPNGGYNVQRGSDINANSVLDAEEIKSENYLCNAIDGKNGSDGKDGLNGSDGKDSYDFYSKAESLINAYRMGVFRVSRLCSNGSSALGSAFRCGVNSVCTAKHMVACPTGASLTNISFEVLKTSQDTIDYQFTSESIGDVSTHSDHDLAKITVESWPANTPILPIASESQIPDHLDPMLSMSYPLGLKDLYSNVGFIDTALIGHCDNASTYGCLTVYDFSSTNDTDHGSSGGPLIDIKSGKVLGVIVAGPNGENINFTWAVRASRFASF